MKSNAIPPGTVKLEVTCANMPGLLSTLNEQNIPVMNVTQVDDLTSFFCVPKNRRLLAAQVIQRAGGRISNRKYAPGSLLLVRFLRRPVLFLGAVLLLSLTLYLPSKILFVRVNGNLTIPERKIVDAASECGLYFGADRHEVRSEKVKNRLLTEIPDLKWVGVNTRGCVAEISVRERQPLASESVKPMISSIVALRDGVVRTMTVSRGNPICRVGQAVTKGQLLVSGYSDCGRCIYGTKAEAEIYAQTGRVLNISSLRDTVKRGEVISSKRKIGLIIAKKRINFYKGSGISDTSCVRMYYEYPVTLPGGFRLPITLTVQEQIRYNTAPKTVSTEETESLLEQYARSYLESQMIAGKVEQENYQITEREGVLQLAGQYICNEMIGQPRSEEIIRQYEQTN